jgi:hypothetical protein
MQDAATCIEQGIDDNPARAAQFTGAPVGKAAEAWCTRTTNGIANDILTLVDVTALSEGTVNRIKQGRRRVKRWIQTTLGFKSTASAATILSGIEMAHTMCKRQGKFAYNPSLQAPTSSKSSRPEYRAYRPNLSKRGACDNAHPYSLAIALSWSSSVDSFMAVA